MRRSTNKIPKSIIGQFTHEAAELPKETGKQIVELPGKIIRDAINQGTGTEIVKDETEGKAPDSQTQTGINDARARLSAFAGYKNLVINPDLSVRTEQQPNSELSSIPKREPPPLDQTPLPSGIHRGPKTVERVKLSTHESKTGKQ